MSERINHAAEAKKLMELVPASMHRVAQVHATLALVEQQRIANILKLEEIQLRSEGYSPGDMVQEALGIE